MIRYSLGLTFDNHQLELELLMLGVKCCYKREGGRVQVGELDYGGY